MSISKIIYNNTLIGWLKQLGVALLYLLFGYVIHHNFTLNGIVSVICPGSGLALAVLLIGGRRYLWGVFLGALVVNAVSNNSLIGIVGTSLANMLEVLLGVWLITRHDRADFSLNTLADYLRLVILGSAVPAIAGAIIGTSALLLAGFITNADYINNIVHWWMGDTLGIMLVTPLIKVWWQEKFEQINAGHWLEGLLLMGITFVAGQIVFLGWFDESLGDAPLGYIIFSCVTWVAIRMGIRGVTFIMLMIATQALLGAYQKFGFLPDEIAKTNLQNYWLYSLILSVIGMTLAIHVNEIKRTISALQLKDKVLNTIANGVVITDKEGRIEWINHAFSQLTGFSLSEACGHDPRDLVNSGNHDQAYYQSMWETILANKVWRGDIVNRRKDGILYDQEMTITPMADAQHQITHLVAVTQDITERKQMEAQLRDMNAFNISILNSLTAHIAVLDSQGVIIAVNNAWPESNQNILGLNYLDACKNTINLPDEDELDATLVGITAVLAGSQDMFSLEYLCHSPCQQRWFQMNVMPLQGSCPGVVISHKDITKHKQAQATIAHLNEKLEEKVLRQTVELTKSNLSLLVKIEELGRSKQQLIDREAKLNALFNASVEGIVTTDMFGVISSLNAAVETIFGYKPQELMGCCIKKLIPFFLNETDDCSLSANTQLIGQIREIEGMHKSGYVIPLDLSVAKFSIDNTQYLTYIVRDVSLRKLRERQDKEHLDELAHITRLGLMGEMAAGIAHEVNQPLAAISTYTQVSLNLIKAENPDLVKLSEILSKTQQQATRAGQIIHRMKAFVKSHAIRCSTTDVNALIRDAVELCVAELKQNSIQLVFELENSLPPVHVDQIHIEQVIINLIRNSVDALQYSPDKQHRNLIIQSQLTLKNEIQVRVKDNGPGLDEEQQQKILTPFYTTKTDGMGMGLSICRSLIEAHEGTLSFDSQLGKGTTFYFTLPVERETMKGDNNISTPLVY